MHVKSCERSKQKICYNLLERIFQSNRFLTTANFLFLNYFLFSNLKSSFWFSSHFPLFSNLPFSSHFRLFRFSIICRFSAISRYYLSKENRDFPRTGYSLLIKCKYFRNTYKLRNEVTVHTVIHYIL